MIAFDVNAVILVQLFECMNQKLGMDMDGNYRNSSKE